MKFLVTGADGYIGHGVVKELLDLGVDVIATDIHTNNVDYRAIPYAQSAQQVLRQVDKQYKAFYVSIKSKKIQGKKVRLPKYKDKENGRNIFVYTNHIAKVSAGVIYLKTAQGKVSFNILADNIDYRAMPYAQSAQQVLRQVDSQYKAFFCFS